MDGDIIDGLLVGVEGLVEDEREHQRWRKELLAVVKIRLQGKERGREGRR